MTTSLETAVGFASLGLNDALIAALTALGYEEPTPIQREAIPPLLAGSDLLGQAATGTGKTAAFALPLVQRIADEGSERRRPSGLILVPTRELAMQVAEAVHRYGRSSGISVVPIYGGQAIVSQLKALKRGADVVVGTPGRMMDHIKRGSLKLETVRTVVLDEADEMLDMGFADDLEAILDATPATRQTTLFSATMPARIATIARKHLREPVHVKIASEKLAAGAVPRVRQVVYVVQRAHKVAALGRVLDMENPTAAIVFCRTRTEVDELTETLNARGYRSEALHGGMSQEQRDRVTRKLRAGTAELLIATDVAARGLDIEHLSHVFNYDVPSSPEMYVHRIGRTGRAGREGVAITLAEPREQRLVRNIEHVTKQRLQMEAVPTVVDLRTRRLELTRAALREALVAGDLDGYRVVVESLAGEFDCVDIATAAVKLFHTSESADENEEEIPAVQPPRDRERQEQRRERLGAGRSERVRSAKEGKPKRSARHEGGERSGYEVTRLWVGAGRNAGLRPADLVGAIANEAGIDARMIGSIDITERFSIVEVPEDAANEIISALTATKIKGKKVQVRRDRSF